MKTASHAIFYITCLLGMMPGVVSAQPYAIYSNGIEVTDQSTGLIWRRCAEGLSGSACTTGAAQPFTHEGALTRAKTESASSGVAWRLPNVKELASIADVSLRYPSIDTTAFPATPQSPFWSSTPYVSLATKAWYVEFSGGLVFFDLRGATAYVRLVRDGQ